MIDINREQLITFAQAARKFPRKNSGKRISAVTVSRWAIRGVNGRKLDSTKAGRTRLTSVEALQRFMQPEHVRIAAASQRSIESNDYLKAEGF